MPLSSPPSEAVYSADMRATPTTNFDIIQSKDDGSPLRAYMLPAKPADARMLLLSSLSKDVERHEMRTAALEILRQGRAIKAREARILPEHRSETGAEPVDFFALHRGPPPSENVERIRIRWELATTTSMASLEIRVRGMSADGAEWKQDITLQMARADRIAAELWRAMGINLAALRTYMDLPRDPLEKYTPPKLTVSRQNGAAATPGLPGGTDSYYDAKAVTELKAYIEAHKGKLPWHGLVDGRTGLDTGLRFNKPGEPEAAHVIYYDGPYLAPLAEVPLKGLKGQGLTTLQKAFRHLKTEDNLIRELGEASIALQQHLHGSDERTRKLTQLKKRKPKSPEEAEQVRAEVAYYSAEVMKHAATQHDLLRQVRALTAEIDKHRADFLTAYRALVRIAASKREDILARKREHDSRKKTFVERYKDLETIGQKFSRIDTKSVMHMVPHMTMLPGELRLNMQQGLGVVELTRELTHPLTQAKKERQLVFQPMTGDQDAVTQLYRETELIFGSSLRWGPHYALVALYDEHFDKNLLNSSEITITAPELLARMRPSWAEGIRKKGLADQFAKSYPKVGATATQFAAATLNVLHSLELEFHIPEEGGGTTRRLLNGIIHVEHYDIDSKGRVVFTIRPKAYINQLLTGDGARPSYTFTNKKALHAYKNADLISGPALQASLENMARAACLAGGPSMIDTEGGYLLVGQSKDHDLTTVGRLAETLGIWGGDNPKTYRHLLSTFKALEKQEVAEFVFVGRTPNKWAQRLRIRMNPDYPKMYNWAKESEQMRKEAKEDDAPFAPRRR